MVYFNVQTRFTVSISFQGSIGSALLSRDEPFKPLECEYTDIAENCKKILDENLVAKSLISSPAILCRLSVDIAKSYFKQWRKYTTEKFVVSTSLQIYGS